ncbi:hypothetical protein HPB51_016870 [Rhipicephalus microplus]|uniref:Uncharacterized protein n=1 Tax=Rhipicephalus microplus TaxID=6941 RepID=A0A9J6DIA5_RHIMP|nr:hypothetical protein HPB51_016870 [Rhipicephalus microplus]
MTGRVASPTIGCEKSKRGLARLRCRRCCSAGGSGRLVLADDLGQVECFAGLADLNFWDVTSSDTGSHGSAQSFLDISPLWNGAYASAFKLPQFNDRGHPLLDQPFIDNCGTVTSFTTRNIKPLLEDRLFSGLRRCYGLVLSHATTCGQVTRRRPSRSRYGCALHVARPRQLNHITDEHRIPQVFRISPHCTSQYTG